MKAVASFLLLLGTCCSGCNTPDTVKQDSDNLVTVNNKAGLREAINEPQLVFSNERFRDVRVSKITAGSISISGKAQVFEAVFNWALKAGAKEIKSGHQMTGAGAPEWGAFAFRIEVPKPGSNGPLQLELFEYSAEDGSKKFGLSIPLR